MKRLDVGLKKAAIAVFCLVTLAVWIGCNEGHEHKDSKDRIDFERRTIEDLETRNKPGRLTAAALDSLRAMKERFSITRDEYFEGDGGVLENDFFELWYPPGTLTISHGMFAFSQMVEARNKFKKYFGEDPGDHFLVVCVRTMPQFHDKTGLDWWHYSKLYGDGIVFQPIDILFQRQLAEVAVQRGYYEWGIRKISEGRCPYWLSEGLASLMSNEGWVLVGQIKEFEGQDLEFSVRETDKALKNKNDRMAYRTATYIAWTMVERLTARYGQEKIAEAIRMMGAEKNVDKVFETVFGQSYDEVTANARDFKVGG
ncbi:MAG: hypothetical protein PVF33_11815 [Candidatus Latescibacterota bacterium]